jgi:hypothetical protein
MNAGFPFTQTVRYDKRYIHDWLKGEGAGNEGGDEFTRAAATIKAGEGVIPHGAVLAIDTASGKYVWHKAGTSDGSETPKALLLYDVDATANDVDIAVLVRRCVVIGANLVFHPSIDTPAEKAATLAALAEREIVSRASI